MAEGLPDLPADPGGRVSGVPVIVACADGRVVAVRWSEPPRFGPHRQAARWTEYDGCRLFRPRVTHWMPFPPHPAGSEAGAEAAAAGDRSPGTRT